MSRTTSQRPTSRSSSQVSILSSVSFGIDWDELGGQERRSNKRCSFVRVTPKPAAERVQGICALRGQFLQGLDGLFEVSDVGYRLHREIDGSKSFAMRAGMRLRWTRHQVRTKRWVFPVAYRPASQSFGPVDLPVKPVPDITHLKMPVKALKELAQQCTDALDPFSRWLGRHPDERASLVATALLPAELVKSIPNETLERMDTWLEDQLVGRCEVVLDIEQLLAFWPSASAGKRTHRETVSLCELLSKNGYGIEPDVRFGGKRIGQDKVVVFREKTASSLQGVERDRMIATLDLAMAVVAIDRPDEDLLETLTGQLVQALELPAEERSRVTARLHWAAMSSPKLSHAKRTMAEETRENRERLGQLLVELATQRGVVGPAQVSGLTKAYTALGLEPASMYSLIHQRSVAPQQEPVEIRGPSTAKPGEAIPAPPQAEREGAIVLDKTAIAATLAASAESTALLGKIFVDDEPPAPVPTTPGSISAPYTDLLGKLAAQTSWTQSEFGDLAASLGLLPNRAIEVLNEAALEQWGDPLLEGDDVLDVNHEVLKELLG